MARFLYNIIEKKARHFLIQFFQGHGFFNVQTFLS